MRTLEQAASCQCEPPSSYLFNNGPQPHLVSGSTGAQRVLALTGDHASLVTSNKAAISLRTNSRYDGNAFASNSVSGCLRLEKPTDASGCGVDLYYKIIDEPTAELRGAEAAARYFPLTQQPLCDSERVLWYPIFTGRSQAELRYLYYTEDCDDLSLTHVLLDAELRKAEDTLRAYCKSYQAYSPRSSVSTEQSIHRFSHSRLTSNGTRLQKFYGQGVRIGQTHVPFYELMSLPIRVNDKLHPCLLDTCQEAARMLDPSILPHEPTVFGLGDAHGGNVMISDEDNAHGHREILYIDYEVAGHHFPLLDLAKPLYNDVFFQTLMGDGLATPGSFSYAIDSGVLNIHLTDCADDLSKAILEVKKRYLIEPFLLFARSQGHDLAPHVGHLSQALFACAILTKNYTAVPDVLLRSIAIGAVLSQATTFEDLWLKIDSLIGQPV